MPLGYLGGFQRPLFHRPSESLHNTVQPQHLPQAKEGGCCLLPLGSTPSSPSLCQHGDGQEGASLPRSHQGRTPPPAAETLKPQPQGEAAPLEAGGGHLQDHKSHQPHQPAQEQGDEEEKHGCLTRAGSGVMLGTAPRSSSPHVHALLAFLLPVGMHGLAGQVTFESGRANMVKTPPAKPSAPQIGHLAPPETRQWSGSSSLGRT